MVDAVEEAMSPERFSLGDYLVDINYPEQSVLIHIDAYTANEKLKAIENKTKLEKQIKDEREATTERTIDDNGLWTDLAEAQELIEELDTKITKTDLTFTMRGMSPAMVEELTSKYFIAKEDEDDPQKNRDRDNELIARSIIRVTNSKGAVDSHSFEAAEVETLRGKLLDGEFMKLVRCVAEVNLNGALFNQAVDAPFPS